MTWGGALRTDVDAYPKESFFLGGGGDEVCSLCRFLLGRTASDDVCAVPFVCVQTRSYRFKGSKVQNGGCHKDQVFLHSPCEGLFQTLALKLTWCHWGQWGGRLAQKTTFCGAPAGGIPTLPPPPPQPFLGTRPTNTNTELTPITPTQMKRPLFSKYSNHCIYSHKGDDCSGIPTKSLILPIFQNE